VIYLKALIILLISASLISEGIIHFISRPRNPGGAIEKIVVLANGSDPQRISLKERLDRAAEAHSIYPNTKILLTGDENRGEIEPMKAYLLDSGVDASMIEVDSRSKSTWQSAQNAANFVDNISGPTLLVTNDFHMNRALATFQFAGIKVYPYGRDTQALPEWLTYFARERLSRIKWLAQYIQVHITTRLPSSQ